MSAPPPSSPPPPPLGRLLLVRHGRTEWARTGQHTGRTDVPLDETGRDQARGLAGLLDHLLGERAPALVLSSPLRRARDTAHLAGLDERSPVVVDEDLCEWDYGAYEGLTTAQIREQRGDDWTAFADGMAPGGPGQFPGESLQDVAARAARVLGRVRAAWSQQAGEQRAGGSGDRDEHRPLGDVVCVGHGHALRVLATVWLGLPPQAGAALILDAGSVCLLDSEHDVPGIRHWNLTPALVGAVGPR